jgi:DNA-binding NarL/FixJ family response regulator
MTGLDKKTIVVIGPKQNQNMLMCHYLERETGAMCVPSKEGYKIPADRIDNGSDSRLILWDCQDMGVRGCLKELDELPEDLAHDMVAAFNVNPEDGLEKEGLAKGLWGFFYEHDPLERFPLGVRAIFNGELWVSRRIMTDYLLTYQPVRSEPEKEKLSDGDATAADFLTEREIEILGLISTGATNADIAEKLIISQHTVKTHIYNIFQKIGVPNRLQAALWAGKHL